MRRYHSPREALKTVFGYDAFRGFQEQAISTVLAGEDALVLMPTGGGKSLCYQIPALLLDGVTIVISPLIALMQDQVDALEEAGVQAAFMNSSQSEEQAAAVRARLFSGELDLLYVSPERATKGAFRQLLSQIRVSLFAIDEAHCVSIWGHDFRPDYRALDFLREEFPTVPRIALTATADERTREEIVSLLLKNPKRFVASFDRPNIFYQVVEKRRLEEQLLSFIRYEHTGDSGIVYCLSRSKTEEIALLLNQNGIRALPYHAGLSAQERAHNQALFLREDGVVMVATVAFGMGVDKPNVRFIAHVDMPRSIENYFQETGRAGRDGLPADAWMAFGLKDVVNQRYFIDQSDAEPFYKTLCTQKLDAMLGLAEATDCRRVRLLAYFGEKSTPCGKCDNCVNPPETVDRTREAMMLVSCIYRVQQARGVSCGAQHVINILRGIEGDRTKAAEDQKLSTWGIGAELSDAEWRVILRQLIARHVVWIHSATNLLRLGDEANTLLRGGMQILVRKRQHSRRGYTESNASNRNRELYAALSPREKVCFEALKTWRSTLARELNKPPYVIFNDATLLNIAHSRPSTEAALLEISGVGQRKADRYGSDVLTIVSTSLENG